MNTISVVKRTVVLGILLALGAATPRANGQTLPSTAGATFTVAVAEQASVSFPSSVSFSVNNVGASTSTTTTSGAIAATSIVLTDLHKIKISLQANAATFTGPVAGQPTYNAGDVTWTTGTWTNGSGSAGTLATSLAQVYLSTANPASVSGTMTFSLASRTDITRAGNYTLSVTWKIESI